MNATETIRAVLSEHARLPIDVGQLSDDADLYRAGLTSHASISLMLALEDAFDVEFPSSAMRKSTFASIASIREVVTGLSAEVEVTR